MGSDGAGMIIETVVKSGVSCVAGIPTLHVHRERGHGNH